jgi:superfamily II DNA or RNA helicase
MRNVTSKIKNVPSKKALQLINNKLSYEVGGFASKKETKYLFNIKNKTTYTGLIPHVLRILSKMNIKYKIIDKRKKPESNANFKIIDPFKPRKYQAPIINRTESREIIQAATGAGKTYIMAELAAKFNIKPLLIIAPKVSLVLQIKNEFEKFLNVNKIGIVGGGHNNIQDITVATPQSAPNELIKKAKGLFYDECHNLPADSLFNIAKNAKNAYYRIGVSATPWRDGDEDMLIESALNVRKPYLSLNASKLIKIGKLTPVDINFIPVEGNCNKWQGNYHKTYNCEIVNNNKRNNIITNLTKKLYNNDRSTLILIQKIKHGELLLNKIKDQLNDNEDTLFVDKKGNFHNVNKVEFISGKDDLDRREAVFEATRKGFCKILIGSTIADEGLDIPRLDSLILAGAGKASTRTFQRIGRVLRLHDKKDKALVYDFIDSYKTFYNQSKYRKKLYKTEPKWNINILKQKEVL